MALGIVTIALAASFVTSLPSTSVISRDIGQKKYLIAQSSYRGYLTCDSRRDRNCEIELNRRKASIKDLCYSIWSNNWPERAQLDPSTVRLYQDWCRQASSDIDFASREFSPLVDYIGKARKSNPQSLSSSQLIDSTIDSISFLGKCSSKTAQKAANAMELWGTREHGDWTVRKLETESPTRYREVLTACERKSWARRLNETLVPLASEALKNQYNLLNSLKCLSPEPGKAWTVQNLTANKDVLSKQQAFISQIQAISTLKPSMLSELYPDAQSIIASNALATDECNLAISSAQADLEKQQLKLLEQERLEEIKAIRAEQKRASDAAARERQAAEQRASFQRKQQQKQKLQNAIDSVILE